MKKLLLLTSLFFLPVALLHAQHGNDSLYLVQFNQDIDTRVVKRDTVWLRKAYAPDFVFSHGSGRVEGVKGWLTTVGRADYALRQHDSVKAELHGSVAVVKGKMAIEKVNKEKTDRYHLRYIRVYAYRDKQWWLVSHNTTHEWHEN